jgi:hypothetical protein
MSLDDLANKVLNSIKGDRAAIKKISEALASRDPEQIKQAFSETAKMELTREELDLLISELESNPTRIAAYPT